MASQKRSRTASARTKNGSASPGGTATRTGQQGARGGRGQDGRAQNGRAQNGQRDRAPGGRGPDGRGPAGRGSGGRAESSRQAGAQARARAATAEPLAAAPPVRRPPPRWFQLTTLGLSVAALGVSIYLTIVHYSSTNLLVCSNKGTIDCEKVITSPQSMIFGVFPVAVLGLAFYVFMVAINTPWAWRSPLQLIWWARLGGIVTGIGFVLYLLYAEFIQIRNVCLWCTSVHAITFVLFVMLVFYATLGTGATSRAEQ
jgi:uncharacterized membrane protein